MSNFTGCAGNTIFDCKLSSTANARSVVGGAVLQGAAPAAVAVGAAALVAAPLALGATSIGAIAMNSVGASFAVNSFANTAESCLIKREKFLGSCGEAAGWTAFSVGSAGLQAARLNINRVIPKINSFLNMISPEAEYGGCSVP